MDTVSLMISASKPLMFLFIYLGTVCYVTASYFHLKLEKWTFLTAFLIALPIVCIEYQFSLRANRIAMHTHGFNPVQILLITLCFYFINIWLLNYFVIKNQKVVLWREVLCFTLILAAFWVSTNM